MINTLLSIVGVLAVLLLIVSGTLLITSTVRLQARVSQTVTLKPQSDGKQITVYLIAVDKYASPPTYLARYPDGHEGHVGEAEITAP